MNLGLGTQWVANFQLIKVHEYLQSIIMYWEEWMNCKTLTITVVTKYIRGSFVPIVYLFINMKSFKNRDSLPNSTSERTTSLLRSACKVSSKGTYMMQSSLETHLLFTPFTFQTWRLPSETLTGSYKSIIIAFSVAASWNLQLS